MFARITTGQLKVSHIDTAASIWQKSTTEQAKPMNGFKFSYLNVDKTSGKYVVTSFWETEADAKAVGGVQPSKMLEALKDYIDESVPAHLEILGVLAHV
jgi:hypothetical protein